MSLRAIAEQLNREGFVPPKRAPRFTGEMVGGLLRRSGRAAGPRHAANARLGEHEWWPGELASRLGMSLDGLRRWMRVGWVHTRRLADSRGRWVVWADDEEIERLRQLRACDQNWGNRERRARLTVPKPRGDS